MIMFMFNKFLSSPISDDDDIYMHAGICLCSGNISHCDQKCWTWLRLCLGSGWRDYCSLYWLNPFSLFFPCLFLFVCLSSGWRDYESLPTSVKYLFSHLISKNFFFHIFSFLLLKIRFRSRTWKNISGCSSLYFRSNFADRWPFFISYFLSSIFNYENV